MSSWLTFAHEVPPGRLQPHGVRAVGGLDDGEPVAEPADLAEHGGGLPAAALQRRQVDLHRQPVRGAGGDLPARRPGARVGQAAADQPEVDGARVVQDHLARSGQDGEPGVGGAEHAQQEVGQGRAGFVGRSAALLLHRRGPAPQGDATAEPGQQRHRSQERTTPAGSRPHGRRAPRPNPTIMTSATTDTGDFSTSVHGTFTCVPAADQSS